MQKIIDAERSEFFGVVAFVAYASPTLTREERAAKARSKIGGRFNSKQEAFLEFVLAQYVKVGVHELEPTKLSPLLKLRYKAIADAFQELGRPDEVKTIFAGFQKHLYETAAA